MTAATTVRVQVRPHRAITLTLGEGDKAYTVLHVAGAELELDPADAKALAEQGFIELAGGARVRPEGRERERRGDEDELE